MRFHHAVLAAIALDRAAGYCSSWCNAYTGALSSCSSCSVTAEVDGGK